MLAFHMDVGSYGMNQLPDDVLGKEVKNGPSLQAPVPTWEYWKKLQDSGFQPDQLGFWGVIQPIEDLCLSPLFLCLPFSVNLLLQ